MARALIVAAALCALIAVFAVVFEVNEPKLYPATIAASLMFGWASFWPWTA